MHGTITALVSALCYAIANLLLRKGQKSTHSSDNGLFPILFISGIILLVTFVFDIIEDPAPLIEGPNWIQSIGFCVLSGVIATLFGRLALYSTIARIGATRAAIFIAMSPFVTLIIALTILGEKLSLVDALGIVVMFFGVVFLLLESKLFPQRLNPTGLKNISIALIAVFFQGIGYSFRKIGVQFPIDPIFASILDIGSAFIAYSILLSALGQFKHYIYYYRSHLNVYIICAGFVLATAVFLFFDAVMEVPVSTVSVIMGTQPVLVALMSGIFIKKMERLTSITFLSSILVSIGVILIGM